MGPHVAGSLISPILSFFLSFKQPFQTFSLILAFQHSPFHPSLSVTILLSISLSMRRERPPVPTLTSIHCLPPRHVLDFLPVTGEVLCWLLSKISPPQCTSSHSSDPLRNSAPSPGHQLFICLLNHFYWQGNML